MRLHPNARRGPHTRGLFEARVLTEGWTVQRAAAGWIEWYTRSRPQQALGYLSPHDYRAQQLNRVACEEGSTSQTPERYEPE